jgi:hypothetical protein
MERLPEEIEWYFERFIQTIKEHQLVRSELCPMRYLYGVRAEKGRVYWRIVIDHYESVPWTDENPSGKPFSTRIFGFVRRKDGAIFRAATFKAPETRTKTAIRGYIYDENVEDYFTDYGITYAPTH